MVSGNYSFPHSLPSNLLPFYLSFPFSSFLPLCFLSFIPTFPSSSSLLSYFLPWGSSSIQLPFPSFMFLFRFLSSCCALPITPSYECKKTYISFLFFPFTLSLMSHSCITLTKWHNNKWEIKPQKHTENELPDSSSNTQIKTCRQVLLTNMPTHIHTHSWPHTKHKGKWRITSEEEFHKCSGHPRY